MIEKHPRNQTTTKGWKNLYITKTPPVADWKKLHRKAPLNNDNTSQEYNQIHNQSHNDSYFSKPLHVRQRRYTFKLKVGYMLIL
jgi:hypothetical protein